MVRVQPPVEGAVLLLVVEEVEDRPPRFTAPFAPAHLHHVALRAVGDRDVEVLGALGDRGMADMAPAALDPVQAESENAVVEVAVEEWVAGGEGGEPGEEGLPGRGGCSGIRIRGPRLLQAGRQPHAKDMAFGGDGCAERNRDPDPASTPVLWDFTDAGGVRGGIVGAVPGVGGRLLREGRQRPHRAPRSLGRKDARPGGRAGAGDLQFHGKLLSGPVGHASNPVHPSSGDGEAGRGLGGLGREGHEKPVSDLARQGPCGLENPPVPDGAILRRDPRIGRSAARAGAPTGAEAVGAPREGRGTAGPVGRQGDLVAVGVQQRHREAGRHAVLHEVNGIPETRLV